jgi:hypothetical protein
MSGGHPKLGASAEFVRAKLAFANAIIAAKSASGGRMTDAQDR